VHGTFLVLNSRMTWHSRLASMTSNCVSVAVVYDALFCLFHFQIVSSLVALADPGVKPLVPRP